MKSCNKISIFLLDICSIQTCVTTGLVCVSRGMENTWRRRSEKCIAEGSDYAHWIGLYLSFRLSWVLGPFLHGRLQNMKTNGHFLTWHNPFNNTVPWHCLSLIRTFAREWNDHQSMHVKFCTSFYPGCPRSRNRPSCLTDLLSLLKACRSDRR